MAKKLLSLVFSLFTLSAISNAQENNYNEISLPELMKKKQQGDNNIVIVDVRTKAEYYDTVSRNKQSNIGRIKGAISIPVQELQQNPDALKQLDQYRDKDIYLICSHSYRSRSASNILLKNGFTHVNNVRGGMTEWYRRYDELAAYRNDLEKGVSYQNLSPSQLLKKLNNSMENTWLIGIRNTPRFWYDSMTVKFYSYFPLFKKADYYNYSDSLRLLEEARKSKTTSIVLFNTVNNGAAELAEWLTAKGVQNVSYLVGGEMLFYEYVSNRQDLPKTAELFTPQTGLQFITPVNYCKMIDDKNLQLIDVRHDSLFNKVNDGVKHDYKHLKDAVNYFAGNGTESFVQKFTDKKKGYVLVSENGIDGLDFANELSKKGYKIYWLTNGLQRWEWYMNNVEDFRCNDRLVE
jgi:rhodanese-related sulfurtransferase